MSHFTTIRTRFTSLAFLKQALDDQGLAWEEGDLTIRGFLGQRTPVQLRVPTRNHGYDIGFRQVGREFEMVADWYGITEHAPEPLLNALSRRYAYHAAVTTLQAQDFSLVQEEAGPGQEIHLVLRRQAN